jgi:Protein of unknown function (DUF3300)
MKSKKHAIAAAVGLALLLLVGCKKEQPAAPAAPVSQVPAQPAPAELPPPSAEELAKAAEDNSQALTANDTTWTPEALEELLAPIALYPDSVLEQVLVASTNPQEVLDAGNWLFDNKALKGKALDEAADEKGFTPPVLALIQFPDTIDLLCQQMAWTTELGQAYVNDQAGVLDAVQRLRRQAKDVGSLQSSPQLAVASQTVDKVEYITVASPSPEVVYVPQYDPVAAYAPQPEVTTSSTTVIKQGHSTGALLLAFGAGILVNEIFDNDNDRYCRRYYYSYRCRGGSYWGRPPYYYPPYPYRPNYGNGFYPGHGYYRPGYNRPGFNNNNNNNINININNNYWDRYPNRPRDEFRRKEPRSPITAARPKRDELRDLNRMAAKGPKRVAPRTGPEFNDRDQFKAARLGKDAKRDGADLKGSYKGAKPGKPVDRMAAGKAAGQAATRDLPKVQGSYKGKDNNRPNRDVASRPAPQDRKAGVSDRARPAVNAPSKPDLPAKRPATDRGYGSQDRMQRPQNDRMQRPDNDRVQQPQNDRMERPQNDRMQRPDNDRMQRPQNDRMQRPDNDRMQRPQNDRMQRPDNDRMQRPQNDRMQRPQNDRMQRPQPSSRQNRDNRASAVSRSSRSGSQERAASQRGRSSQPSGAAARTKRRDNR